MKKKTKRRSKKGSIPDWAKSPFQDFLDDADRLRSVVELSCRGIYLITNTPNVIKVLQETSSDEEKKKDYKENMKKAEKDAALARKEWEADFPLTHGYAIIGLWSLLEQVIKTFCAEWVMRRKATWENQDLVPY